MWISPLWKDESTSHPFLTFRWSGDDDSYFALSHGWWEPRGARKLYVVLSNQESAFCYMPGQFDYTLFLTARWTMLTVTWQAGDPGLLTLYVDGRQVCERRIRIRGHRTAELPLFLGADSGATDRRARPAEFAIDDVFLSAQALSDDEVWSTYQRVAGNPPGKWLQALLSERTVPGAPSRETRVMVDEDAHWAKSTAEMRRTIDRIKGAGFNVYVPCVWNGSRALFKTTRGPMAATIRETDPLEELIRYAHERGIQIHPWFILVRRPDGALPAIYSEGAPPNAFNIHSVEFRRFIADLVVDAVERYDIDGLNLDYVRSMGVCSDASCAGRYRHRYGRAIAEDWEAQARGKVVPSLAEFNGFAMTQIVRDISTSTRRLRPSVPISIDSVPFDHSRRHQGMNEQQWLAEGLIDSIFYMSYGEPLDIWGLDTATTKLGAQNIVVLMRNYEHLGRQFVGRPGPTIADLVKLTRLRWPRSGIGFYHYPHMDHDQFSVLRSSVFDLPAAPIWPSRR